jgi:hypothetical protein
MTTDRGLCAYAITRGQEWDGIAFPELHFGGTPELVTQDGLGLVVAEADLAVFRELSTELTADGQLETLVREHDAVIRAVFDHESVLPLRFGTVVADTAAARQLLIERHDEVSTWLSRVAGHREWGLRIEYESVDDTPLTGLSGADYLRLRQQSLMSRQKRADVVRSLHAELVRFATSSFGRERPRALLDAAYLVHQENEEKFRAAAAWLSEEVGRFGATVHATGPWPPYSFTRIELAVFA